MSKILGLTGIGIPVLWASAAYGFFLWLDRNASEQAISTINSWLQGRPYERIEMRNAIVSLFDRIYTYPLWKPRAILRSVTISTTLFLIFMIYHISAHLAIFESTFAAWWSFLLAVVLSDYISLYVVRSYLTVARGNLLISLFLALTYGTLVVFWTYRIGVVLAIKGMDNFTRFLIVTMAMDMSKISLTYVNRIMERWGLFFVPAIVVHLWFPLFALGALGVRLIYFLFWGVHLAQWFLKQGDKHPIQAIGIVAAAVVFVGTAIWKLVAPII